MQSSYYHHVIEKKVKFDGVERNGALLPANILLHWKQPGRVRHFRTAVSLHSHTLYSKETLAFIPRIARSFPPLAMEIERQRGIYRDLKGVELDFDRGWWTPPLTPAAAWHVEREQIGRLGLDAQISITDHDSIEAPLKLAPLNLQPEVPVSVEWTVPWRGTYFHVGVHNLPAADAQTMFTEMGRFTARPDESRLGHLLDWFQEDPAVLIVWNHPFWDEAAIGSRMHRTHALEFLQLHKRRLHALEINGFRPWKENLLTVDLSKESAAPVISGGDRHGREPNACLNLTNARTFAEFAAEVRCDGRSEILLMPQYKKSHSSRIFFNLLDILRDDPDHGMGWRRWSDRVFYQEPENRVRSLADHWEGEYPFFVTAFTRILGLLQSSAMRSALQLAVAFRQEPLP